MTDMHEVALRLWSAGFVPVPLLPGMKHLDLGAVGWQEHHRVTRQKALKNLLFAGLLVSLDQNAPKETDVAAWFSKPGGNIGIAAGCGGLVVLDIDGQEGFERLKARHGALIASTPISRSPFGWHIYLHSATPMVSSSLHEGFRRIGHVKALGGYVVCPPSRTRAGGEYVWLDGQSAFEMAPQSLSGLDELGLSAVNPLKAQYDRLLGRGSFADR